MTRNFLLTLAAQSVFRNGDATDLALRLTTVDAVQTAWGHYSNRVVALSARAAVCHRVFLSCVVVLFLALALMGTDGVPGYWTPDPMWLASTIAGALAIMLLAAGVGSMSAELRDCTREKLELLVPVVNSPACQSALEYIEAGEPEVLAWRDLAIGEREVLSGFDVFILRDILYSVRAAREAARIQSAHQAACRQLYGIAGGVASA
jgi:hypothetical protein